MDKVEAAWKTYHWRKKKMAEQQARIEQLEAALRSIEKRDGCGPDFIICHECRQSSMEATAALQETDGE